MIKLMIFLLIAMSLSCDADGQGTKSGVPVPMPTADQPDVKVGEPGAVVSEFMKFISSGEKDKANALLTREVKTEPPSSNLSPDKVHKGLEVGGSRLDWVPVLTERKFRLGTIVEEKTDGDKSQVTADLGVTDLENFRERARFNLVKVDGRWLISDVELQGKPPAK